MVSFGSGALTKIGFRKDVRIFLGALVGYLVFVILALVMVLQGTVIELQQSHEEHWDGIGRSLVRDLNRLPAPGVSSIEQILEGYRAAHHLVALEVRLEDGTTIRTGFSNPVGSREIRLAWNRGSAMIQVDDSRPRGEKRRFALVTMIALASTIGMTILLVLYLPKIVGPIQAMLDHAQSVEEKAAGVDEANFLVDTFRKTVNTLRVQREELARLHEMEKTRADELERVVATLQRSITSGLIATDANGRVVKLNQAAREILQLGDCDAEVPLAELLPRGGFADALVRCLRAREELSRYETTQPVGGSDVAIGLSAVPIVDDRGEFLGLVAIFTDLTPFRELEGRVRELETLADLGQISAGIAHEFRNSLSTILGYLRLAQRAESIELGAERVALAEREAQLLAQAVEKLLGFARPMEVEFHDVDLRALVDDLVSRLHDEAAGIELAVTGGPAVARGDAPLLRVAIENLVRNAIDSVRRTGRPGKIGIVVQGDPRPSIRIEDNGVGIDPSDAARLFLPFQSDRPGGFGLGLAIARKIVLLHGGDIRLTGVPGKGAAVNVELDARAPAASAAAAPG